MIKEQEMNLPQSGSSSPKLTKNSVSSHSQSSMEVSPTNTNDLKMEKLMELENKSAQNMYLGTETGASIKSLSLSMISDITSLDSDVTSTTSSGRIEREEDSTDYSVLDRYGFIVVAPKQSSPTQMLDEDEQNLKRRQEKRGRKEAQRGLKWIEMLKTLEFVSEKREWPRRESKFASRLVKGIPECLRTKIWSSFLSVPTTITSPSSVYKELYLKISGYERQIDLDIERTLRDHILFKARFSSAQVSLFKVLVAYSNYDPEVGYCQGMSTIVAFLLLYFEEEISFCMMKNLMKRQDLRSFFTAGFPLLFETFYVQEELMKKYIPALFAKLESFHITTSVYATKWYLTLFLGFPFSLACRVWDLFLFWGIDILVCAALSLLKLHEHHLMSLEYERCLQFLSKLPEMPIDENKFIRLTWTIWKRVHPHYNEEDSEEKNTFSILRRNYGKVTTTTTTATTPLKRDQQEIRRKTFK